MIYFFLIMLTIGVIHNYQRGNITLALALTVTGAIILLAYIIPRKNLRKKASTTQEFHTKSKAVNYYDNRPWLITKEQPFESVAKMEIKDGNATVNIRESFLNYMEKLTKSEKDKVMTELVDQVLEREVMRVKEDHPFHKDEKGFELYARSKYQILYKHINRHIDQLLEDKMRVTK